jgi:methionine aminopeptidase
LDQVCRYQAEKRILSNPDQLTIEWAGTFKHYHSAMMRTIPIGKANPKHFKMHEACLEALSNCEKKLKPGNKVGDVFDTHAETFENLGNRRYEWKCNNLNSASKNAAKRLGFKFEGVFRQMFVFKGKNRDTVWFAIIDKEWKKLKKGYLKFFKISNFDKNYKQIKKLRFE